jgi:hypothetical protein
VNLVLTYCWREWRAQRGVLAAFTAMGLAALAIVFLVLPEHWWLEDGRCALALSWFVVIGAVGVIAFAAPALVRGEYGPKGDQFVKRLPGALLPSFGGKLLFLALASAALPLLCLLAGEGFLLAIGRPWHDLFRWDFAGDVTLVWPWAVPLLGYAALLTTWVWALGCWLPNGRMALGATILFVLAVGASVVVVLRQSPGIEKGIAWRSWLWLVPVLGVAVAGASWVRGRRGGGAWRSARLGGAVAAIGLVPPGAWFAARAHDYHHPDPQRLAWVQVRGITPDHCHALVDGATHDDFAPVPFRVRLRDGDAVQAGGMGTSWESLQVGCIGTSWESLQRGPRAPGLWDRARYWSAFEWSPWANRIARHRVIDLTTLAEVASSVAATPEAMRAEVAPQVRPLLEREPIALELRAPGGVAVWFDGGELCFAVAAGRVERVRWEGDVPLTVLPCGHGFTALGAKRNILFDLTARQPVPVHGPSGFDGGWLVRGVHVHGKPLHRGWWRRERGAAESTALPELDGALIRALLDDDRLLCQWEKARGGGLFTWDVASGALQPIALPLLLPADLGIGVASPLLCRGSLAARDPAGFVWLTCQPRGRTLWLRLDPCTGEVVEVPFVGAGSCTLLAWLDAASCLVQDGRAIRRVDVATGAATQLFPRADGGAR